MRSWPLLVDRLRALRPLAFTALSAATFASVFATVGCTPDEVPVTIHVVDAASGEATPSRLEVIDSEHQPHIAINSIPVTFECFVSPLPEWLAPLQTRPSIFNPYTGTTQFYADGAAQLSLTPGTYRIRVAKGPEWRRTERTIEVESGEGLEVTVELERWADPAREGWYGVDDHLHITRMHPDDNHRIARWMRAEGLHIANLLEMGTAAQISVTPQYAYGDAGAHRDGPLLLLTGQEHPRTHFLGHTITLGTEERVDRRTEYIVYESTFGEGERLGGVSDWRRSRTGSRTIASERSRSSTGFPIATASAKSTCVGTERRCSRPLRVPGSTTRA
jgi:hypothetical protein